MSYAVEVVGNKRASHQQEEWEGVTAWEDIDSLSEARRIFNETPTILPEMYPWLASEYASVEVYLWDDSDDVLEIIKLGWKE